MSSFEHEDEYLLTDGSNFIVKSVENSADS